MATPVTLVPNGTPATPTLGGIPVTIVDASGQASVAVVSNAQALTIPITGTYSTKITLTVAGGVVTAGVLS